MIFCSIIAAGDKFGRPSNREDRRAQGTTTLVHLEKVRELHIADKDRLSRADVGVALLSRAASHRGSLPPAMAPTLVLEFD